MGNESMKMRRLGDSDLMITPIGCGSCRRTSSLHIHSGVGITLPRGGEGTARGSVIGGTLTKFINVPE